MMIHSTRTTITPRTIQPVVDMAGLQKKGMRGLEEQRRTGPGAGRSDRCRFAGAMMAYGRGFDKKRPQAFGLGSIHRTAVRGVRGAAVQRLRNHGDLTRPKPPGSWV